MSGGNFSMAGCLSLENGIAILSESLNVTRLHRGDAFALDAM